MNSGGDPGAQEDRPESAVPAAWAIDDHPVMLLLVLAGFAAAVVVQAALGFVGLLAAAPALALVTGTVGLGVFRGRVFVARQDQAPWSAADFAGALALATALIERAWAGLHRSTYLYDVLSYHLHIPAAWRAAGRISIVPTPFGDPAAAYAPANAELLYHLLLAFAGNARLAHAGQIPFAVLAVLAVYTTARQLNASRAIGFAAALAFLLIPEVWQQAPNAMADLAVAAFFLAAIPFLLRLSSARRWPDVVGVGVAVGLLLGTKYLAVVLSAPLLIWAAVVLVRSRNPGPAPRGRAVLLVVILVMTCGGFWYVRNTWVAGNPLFPATIRLGSLTAAPGLFDTAQIRTSEYHLPVTDARALLEIFMETGWGFLAAITLFAVAVRPGRWLALAAVVLLLLWFVVPYQQSRFFFSLWGLGAIVLAIGAGRGPRAGVIGLSLASAGSILQFPTTGRLILVAAAAAGAILGPPAVRALDNFRRARRLHGSAPWIVAVAVVVATIGWARVAPTSPVYTVGDTHDEAWSWFSAHVHAKQVAYTGSNLPFPLWGAHLENEVRYVAVSGGLHTAPHDYLSVPASARTRVTAEPAPEREYPDQAIWLSNLRAAKIDVLFVAALYPSVQQTISHDPAGFPIERSWADADPRRFPLLFANDGVRIYEHRLHLRPDDP